MEKAYKLLAIQEKISNSQAKKLIDNGLVFLHGKKLLVARALVKKNSRFRVVDISKIQKLFEDDNIIAIDKPSGFVSEELEKKFNAKLLHRLDKETSGAIILCKNEDFRLKAIQEFKKENVYKEYIAVVSGIFPEITKIDFPIKTLKGKKAKSIISKDGKKALTIIEPLEVLGKKTKIKAIITTGRTHQIRVHLLKLGYPIIGDSLYGGKEFWRLMLHSFKINIFNYQIQAPLPDVFKLKE